ncbi:MAG: metallophosphoesterase family protein [Mycobacterium leprae]
MRVMHTADWHLGRTLEGRSRLEEQEQLIDELCDIAGREAVDMVLIAGDVFDTFTPPATAEALYFDALARLADGGRRAVVVIAGNHDSPDRLCAVRSLAQRHGITLFGYPADDPGVTTGGPGLVQRVRSGPGWAEIAVPGSSHTAVVLALPYPSESRLNEVLQEGLDESVLQGAYSERIAAQFEALATQYRPETVRMAVGHFFVGGGLETDSERPIQVGGAYTVSPGAMPAGAQYVALGHLHRPQQMHLAPAYTRYAGSPLAYSFSEVGYAKSVTLIDVEPEMVEPTVWEVPLSAGRPLVRWHATGGLAEVEQWVSQGRDANAWIDLEVHVPQALSMEEIQRLRRMHAGFVTIRPVFVNQNTPLPEEERAAPTIREQFQRFYQSRRAGTNPPDALLQLFLELANEAEEEEVEP